MCHTWVTEEAETAHRRPSGESIGQVTVSIGVTEFIPGESFEALFERCDGALYEAKQAGRNCTKSA
ncbi:diguanylate cyclase [Bradyrhizobium sp. 197]|uniref:diguanylate cyclase domain-containing protein n=1 Tax=Bradyrhizobium sp. 197 TaxID=2782663 RepID=UPI0031F6361E|nr:diguanylate cyclase [Bradyrhizobium sp. 197]